METFVQYWTTIGWLIDWRYQIQLLVKFVDKHTQHIRVFIIASKLSRKITEGLDMHVINIYKSNMFSFDINQVQPWIAA